LRVRAPIGRRCSTRREQFIPLRAGRRAGPAPLRGLRAGRALRGDAVPENRRTSVPPDVRPAWLLLVQGRPPGQGLIMESTRPATIRAPARLRDALSLSALRQLDGEPLIEFLRRQRWFGSKGLPAATARFRGVIPLFREPIDAAVARVEIIVGDSSIATYQLTLA